MGGKRNSKVSQELNPIVPKHETVFIAISTATTNTLSLMSSGTPNLPIYIINLDRAKDRWAQISAHLDSLGLAYTRVPAVEGRHISLPTDDYDEAAYLRLHGKLTNPNEIGCYLSHVKVMREFLASEADYAIILEDDAKLEPGCIEAIQEAIAKHGKKWDLLRLHGVHGGTPARFAKLCGGYSLCIDLTRQTGSAAYLVNRKAANALVSKLLPMKLPYDHAFEKDWTMGFTNAAIHPFCVSLTKAESNIGYDKKLKIHWLKRYLTVLPFRLWTETSRLIHRLIRIAKLRLS